MRVLACIILFGLATVKAQDICSMVLQQFTSSGGCVPVGTCSGTVRLDFGSTICADAAKECCEDGPSTTPEPTTTTPEPTTTLPTTEPPTTPTTVAPPAPVTEQCGVRPAQDLMFKILGGIEGIACEWPWQVSIRGRINAASTLTPPATEHNCAGVLIADQWVLTTAYCIIKATYKFSDSGTAAENIIVMSGDFNLNQIDYGTGGAGTERFHYVSDVIINSGFAILDVDSYQFADLFKPNLQANNMALVKLSTPVTFTNCTRQVCPPREDTGTCWTTRDECVVAGWGDGSTADGAGSTGTLHEASVKYYNPDIIDAASVLSGGTLTSKPLTSFARFTDGTPQDVCKGDEGGMVVCQNPTTKRWELEGLINIGQFSAPCQATDSFRVTDVSAAWGWIDSKVNPVPS